MNVLKKYKMGFDPIALVLFILIMIPNIFWAYVPSANDVLRNISSTPTIDLIGEIFQVIFVFALIFIVRAKKEKIKFNRLFVVTVVFISAYFIFWMLYYLNVVNQTVLLGLCVFPCCAFITYEVQKKNYIALVPTLGFTVCHLIYCILNFIFCSKVIA